MSPEDSFIVEPMDVSDDVRPSVVTTPQVVSVAASALPNSPVTNAKAGLEKRLDELVEQSLPDSLTIPLYQLQVKLVNKLIERKELLQSSVEPVRQRLRAEPLSVTDDERTRMGVASGMVTALDSEINAIEVELEVLSAPARPRRRQSATPRLLRARTRRSRSTSTRRARPRRALPQLRATLRSQRARARMRWRLSAVPQPQRARSRARRARTITAHAAAVNELDVDGWRRTLDPGAARTGVAECDAAATAVRDAAIVARTVRDTHGARAHRACTARCTHFLRIIMTPHTIRTNY
jgi:hypothetical protein